MMMKSKKSDDRPRRALFLLLSGLLATLIALGLAQAIVADDNEPTPPTPDSNPYEKDRMLSEEELAPIESRLEWYLDLESISPDQLLGSELSSSTKDVDRAEAQLGSEVQYTIVISNSGDNRRH